MTERRFLLADCCELHRKGLLEEHELRAVQAWSTTAPSVVQQLTTLQLVRARHTQDVEAIVARLREQHNHAQQGPLKGSDVGAAIAGGLFGAFHAYMQQPRKDDASQAHGAASDRAAPPASRSLWASAMQVATASMDAAKASVSATQQRRHVERLQIQHVLGDESTCEHVVLCINGFMTEQARSNDWSGWAVPNKVMLYNVQWEAGHAAQWQQFLDEASAKAVSATDLVEHFASNPWHKAQEKAKQVGRLLAQVLLEQPIFLRGRRVTLLGHSLGGAIIYSALQELAQLRPASVEPLVANAILLAAAVVPAPKGIRAACSQVAPDGMLVNVHSANDRILSKLFHAVNLHGREGVAIGSAPLDFAESDTLPIVNGRNIDVSDLVATQMDNALGHDYEPWMDAIRARVLKHVTSLQE